MQTCVGCDGVFDPRSQEPPHVMNYNGQDTLWCRDCIEEYSAASWPDDRGPYPGTVYPHARPPRGDG